MKNVTEIATAVRIAVENQLDPMGHDSNELEQLIVSTITKFLPTYEEERIERARHYLCDGGDEDTIADQLALIDAQAEIDASVMLDSVEDIMVWEKVVWSFTVSSFLDEINP